MKKISAILEASTMPPRCLLGTCGIRSPIHHTSELDADLRLEPVPTTSPTIIGGIPGPVSSLRRSMKSVSWGLVVRILSA